MILATLDKPVAYLWRLFLRRTLISPIFAAFSITVLVNTLMMSPALAQTVAPTNPSVSLSATQIAQATAPPQFIPTDVTPFTVAPERNSFSPGYKFRIFQVLPERLWFNSTTEVSQRLDTNVFFTHGHYKPDYAFRVLPNITIGYNILKNTSIYANYFVIKDTFADHTSLNFPTTQSLSWGIQNNKQLGQKTSLQTSFQARELWQASHLHQFDFIPGATLTYMVNSNNILFASTLLQLRGGQYFVAPTREIDPFYTVGYIRRQGQWNFIANDTLVTNFRHPPFNDAIPRQSNMSMIADFEINHPVAQRLPALVAFVRAEPIWNWDSQKAPGISGFDFRLYGGLRLSVSKPSYYGQMDDLRKQIMQSEQSTKPSSANPTNTSGNGNASTSSTDNKTTNTSTPNEQSDPKLRGI